MANKHKKGKNRSSAPKIQPKSKSTNNKWIYLGIGIAIIAVFLFANSNKGSDYPILNTPKPDRGTENAPVLIQEFSDLECPACGRVHPIMKQILENYGDQITWKFYHFPLSYHKDAELAAIGAECANDQGLFWEFIDTVYENQANMGRKDLINYATALGADETFEACLDSNTKDHIIKSDMQKGNEMKLTATPSIYINGKLVTGLSYDDIARMIQAELQQSNN